MLMDIYEYHETLDPHESIVWEQDDEEMMII